MKVTLIDTFLFSEPHEKELLWLKLTMEDNGVDAWIIVENSHTFQGDVKDYFLEEILCNDVRFNKFLPKIKVIKGNIVPSVLFANKPAIFDDLAFTIEYAQRELAVGYIKENFSDDTYIFISDVDEMLDLSQPKKKKYLFKKLANKHLVQIPRNRYWYDFDNYWYKVSISPIVTISYLNATKFLLGKIRQLNMGHTYNWKYWICFEYSFCFPKDAIIRKYNTQSHTGFTQQEIIKSIATNSVGECAARGTVLKITPYWWLKKVRLTEKNAPTMVLNNLRQLKTNVVPNDYLSNRFAAYPNIFGKDRIAQMKKKIVFFLLVQVYHLLPLLIYWKKKLINK